MLSLRSGSVTTLEPGVAHQGSVKKGCYPVRLSMVRALPQHLRLVKESI
jgi:hypothetical protein